MTRLGADQSMLWPYEEFSREKEGYISMTEFMAEFMDEGARLIQEWIEWLMDVLGSSGKAFNIQKLSEGIDLLEGIRNSVIADSKFQF